jgi:hypothetical protein
MYCLHEEFENTKKGNQNKKNLSINGIEKVVSIKAQMIW